MNVTFEGLDRSVGRTYFSKNVLEIWTCILWSHRIHKNLFVPPCIEIKQVLWDLHGNFRAGNLTAIMGPSGAGKSTFMNILAGFTTTGVSGNIFVNGERRNITKFRRSSVYIMQENDLHPLLTVHEAISLAADLKLQSNCNNRHEIQKILEDMRLESVRNTLTKNLSGGEKKRLAIALELISNPSIIFVDEPTSGLDSTTSRQCFDLLKSLAREGRTVVCILHQPSTTIFEMIDHLYVLGKGYCVYSGIPTNVVTYLADLGFECPTYHNPADYLLEVVNGEYGDHAGRLIAAASANRQQNFSKLADSEQLAIHRKLQSFPAGNSWIEIQTLIKYSFIKLSRDRILAYLRLSLNFVIGLVSGILFYGIGQDATHTFDNFKMLFYTVLYLMFLSLKTTIIAFPSELPVLRREHFNGWYKLHSFYLANRISDLPVQLLASTVYLVVIYCMSGQLIEWQRLGMFLLPSLLVSLIAQMVGLIVGTIFDVQTAVILGPFTVLPSMVFSGFFVNFYHAHSAFQWFFHLSFCKYGFDGVMYAIYGLDRPRLPCSSEYCHLASPKVILNEFGAKNLNYWFAVSVLTGLYVFLNFVAYLALHIALKMRKR